jgi:hypothetical protein
VLGIDLGVAIDIFVEEPTELPTGRIEMRSGYVECLKELPDILDPVSGGGQAETLAAVVIDGNSGVVLIEARCKLDQEVNVF